MTDAADVLAANAAFYRAFESLDLARMETVWLSAAHVTCVHPGWQLIRGWGPVMESWRRIFESTLEMRFTLGDAHAETRGGVAWVVVTEGIESRHRDGRIEAHVEATNVFERHEGRWLLVHHHGSPVHAPLDTPDRMH